MCKRESKKEEFVFGVLTYNQEDVVLETLESISFQITHYGQDYLCSLIVSDDGSEDNTVGLVEDWIKRKHFLFYHAEVVKNKINRGTVHNYLGLLEKIEVSKFKIMDGDDIFSSRNLFKLYEHLKDNEIVTSLTCGINEDNKIFDVTNDFFYFKNKTTEQLKHLVCRQNIFISGSTFYKREIITAEVTGFMQQFILLEDYPLWYCLCKKKDTIIKFIDEPYTLYRIRRKSVSHSMKINSSYLEDKKKMTRILKKNGRDWRNKTYLNLAMLSYTTNYIYIQPIKYIDKIIVLYRKLKSYKTRIQGKEALYKNIAAEQKHLNKIQDSVKEYLKGE